MLHAFAFIGPRNCVNNFHSNVEWEMKRNERQEKIVQREIAFHFVLNRAAFYRFHLALLKVDSYWPVSFFFRYMPFFISFRLFYCYVNSTHTKDKKKYKYDFAQSVFVFASIQWFYLRYVHAHTRENVNERNHNVFTTDISCMSTELKSNFDLNIFENWDRFLPTTTREQWIPKSFFIQFTVVLDFNTVLHSIPSHFAWNPIFVI